MMAIGLAFAGSVVTLVSDNVLTPYFYGRGFTAPGTMVLFAVLGGVLFFGPTGFILGPLVLSTLILSATIYDEVLLHTNTDSEHT